jgi:hypothetical protein
MPRILLRVRQEVRPDLWSPVRTPILWPVVEEIEHEKFTSWSEISNFSECTMQCDLSMPNANAVRGIKSGRIPYCIEGISRLVSMWCRPNNNKIAIRGLLYSASKIVNISIYLTIPQRSSCVQNNLTEGILRIRMSCVCKIFSIYAKCELNRQSKDWWGETAKFPKMSLLNLEQSSCR